MAVIRFEDVTVAYQKQIVLERVNLSIEKSVITTFLGPNGSGKTTLMSAINGTIKPARSKIYINDREISKYSTKELARKVATVPQLYSSNFNFTVFDMVLMGRLPYIGYIPGKIDFEKADEALEQIGIGHLREKEFNKLSGGEKQLVMIARAIAQETEIILLDEPTSYLDLKNQLKVLSVVKQINSMKNVTCIMTLHDPNQALMYSDKVVMFKKGTIETGTIDNMINSQSIFDVYGVKAEIHSINNKKYILPDY